jgi:V8-like Glu-specific endopeptidase
MTEHHENRVVGSGRPASVGDLEEEHWTEERRRAAQPVPLPTERPPDEQPVAEEAEPAERGPTGHLPPNPPPKEQKETTGEQAESDASPVLNPLVYPYTTCGKLFFTQNGGGFAGSAAMVAPNVLLTAGHCVYNGGWSTNIAFFPSYPKRAASDPAYHFTYSHVAAWTAWTQNGNRAFDYGMVWFDSAPGNTVGWLGLLWNVSTAGRVWDAVGYPATPAPPFDGNTMDEAVGTFTASSVPGTVGLTNDQMEHGSSGGPWITDFNGSPREYANGLQSFHINDGDSVEYGPYFTDAVKGLFDWISNPANRQ